MGDRAYDFSHRPRITRPAGAHGTPARARARWGACLVRAACSTLLHRIHPETPKVYFSDDEQRPAPPESIPGTLEERCEAAISKQFQELNLNPATVINLLVEKYGPGRAMGAFARDYQKNPLLWVGVN